MAWHTEILQTRHNRTTDVGGCLDNIIVASQLSLKPPGAGRNLLCDKILLLPAIFDMMV